jgi:hypothetical protein
MCYSSRRFEVWNGDAAQVHYSGQRRGSLASYLKLESRILLRFTGAQPNLVERLQGRFDVLQQALNFVALGGTDILFLQPLQ